MVVLELTFGVRYFCGWAVQAGENVKNGKQGLGLGN